MKGIFALVNSVVGGESKPAEKKVVLPWENYKERANTLKIKGSLTDVLRDQMLEIPNDEKSLLDKSHPVSNFDLESHLEVIMKVLEIDMKLRELFRRSVPNRISEEMFWKNYFNRVEEVADEVLKRFSNQKPSESNHY